MEEVFWILDNITPLRQLNPQLVSNVPAVLYKTAKPSASRWCSHPDTPVPQEEPAGQNDGAIIDFISPKMPAAFSSRSSTARGNIIRKVFVG